MKKIISLFERDWDGNRQIIDKVTPGAEWVANGEGVATRKWDGTSCLVRDGKLYKRYDAKHGKTPPPNWEAAQDPDPVTGHWPGWVPVRDGPEDRWHREAFEESPAIPYLPGTYELIGPKIGGNPENAERHHLVTHGLATLPDAPRTFAALKVYLATANIEGIVWHHADGRMVKIKTKDFGLVRQFVAAP